MNVDQFMGRIDVAVARFKGAAGRSLRSPNLEHDALRQALLGRARLSYGNAKASVAKRLNGLGG
jgi:hypothetical protein